MNSSLFFKIIFCAALFFITPGYAWDSVGHRVISNIAYDHLTPAAKKHIDVLTQSLDPHYPPRIRFVYISTLPDQWRKAKNDNSASWHFYDAPWSVDGTPTQPAANPNLLTELEKNKTVLQNPATTPQQKSLALAYFVHLTEDAHQPLHCINLFSKSFPHGDKGGNKFTIKNSHAKNLHAYWDQSARLWLTLNTHYPPTNKKIAKIAQDIEQQFPETLFGAEIPNQNFKQWEDACYALAKNVAYQTPLHSSLSSDYIAAVRETAGKQMALAGYRLAEILNSL